MAELTTTQPRILVVDDEALIIRMLHEMLKTRYELLVATSGEEALALAVAATPELILLDVGLPDLNGYEVCRQLRDNPVTREIPVIFLTNHDERREILRGFDAGGKDYVLKNAGIMELMARIDTHLQLHRQQTALVAALEQNLIQNDKMASLGHLAAGVAHEINNPMGYISSNLCILAEYFDQIVGYDRFRQELADGEPSSPARETIAGRRTTQKIEDILKDGADLIKESLEGAERVMKIVLGLKNFSRTDTLECETVALTSCLENALTIAHNELKYVATIRREYESLEDVLCHPSQLSQVFLNLLVNAGQAIVTPEMGEIVLRSWDDAAFVYASVSDTGKGIPKIIKDRIFDPFFTTKDVGKGTGLGLSISIGIIKKHHGELLMESDDGKGTTFTVKLPRTSKKVFLCDPPCPLW